MKIGIVCPYNIALPGGVQQHVFEQAAELRKRGHTVKVITPNPRGVSLSQDPDIVFLGKSARFRTPQHTSVDVSITVTTEAIDELLQREYFTIIHMHEPLVPILARQMLPRITCPVVGTFHAAMPETVLAKSIAGSITPFVKSVVKHLSAVTAVSPAATSYIDGFVDFSDIHFIPNGIDLKKYNLPEDLTEQKDILYVGRLEKRKGVAYLLQAFAELTKQDSEVRLIIAGDGPDREKLERSCVEYGIDSRVTFLGYIDDVQKLKLMQRCMLFVSPALYGESFGIVLLEAMAAGAVVMGGQNPGYSTVLKGQGAVGLIDPKSVQLFADRMYLLLHDQRTRKLFTKWAQSEVKKYSYENIVSAYEQIYNSLA